MTFENNVKMIVYLKFWESFFSRSKVGLCEELSSYKDQGRIDTRTCKTDQQVIMLQWIYTSRHKYRNKTLLNLTSLISFKKLLYWSSLLKTYIVPFSIYLASVSTYTCISLQSRIEWNITISLFINQTMSNQCQFFNNYIKVS